MFTTHIMQNTSRQCSKYIMGVLATNSTHTTHTTHTHTTHTLTPLTHTTHTHHSHTTHTHHSHTHTTHTHHSNTPLTHTTHTHTPLTHHTHHHQLRLFVLSHDSHRECPTQPVGGTHKSAICPYAAPGAGAGTGKAVRRDPPLHAQLWWAQGEQIETPTYTQHTNIRDQGQKTTGKTFIMYNTYINTRTHTQIHTYIHETTAHSGMSRLPGVASCPNKRVVS